MALIQENVHAITANRRAGDLPPSSPKHLVILQLL